MMEVISRILKLKKQAIEKSIAELIKKRLVIEVEMSELNKDRENRRRVANQISQTKNLLSSMDLRVAQKWQDRSARRLIDLEKSRLTIEMACESLKAELRDLVGKLELSEKQNEDTQFKLRSEQLTFEGERRLENWRLSSLSKD